MPDMELYNIVAWFNSELQEYMDMYCDKHRGSYVLVEKYHCDILSTSRVYTNPISSSKILLPPNSWNGPHVQWKSTCNRFIQNACSLFSFDSLESLFIYLKLLHASRENVPFFQLQKQMLGDRMFRLVDADCENPQRKLFKLHKIYIS